MQYWKKMGECSDFKGSRRNRKKEEKRRDNKREGDGSKDLYGSGK